MWRAEEAPGPPVPPGCSFRPRGDGSTDLHPPARSRCVAAPGSTCDAMTSLTRRSSGRTVGRRRPLPFPRRRSEAFCSLLEQLPADGLPSMAGTATAVMVIVDLETLRSRVSAWPRPPPASWSPPQRRAVLACPAGVPPGRAGSEGRGPRPRALAAAVLAWSAQGNGGSRPPLSRRGLRRPGRLVRSPSRSEPLVSPRAHRPGPRRTALLVPPPPSPQRPVVCLAPGQRRRPLRPADVTARAGASLGEPYQGWGALSQQPMSGIPIR